jgi:hypothetical protein
LDRGYNLHSRGPATLGADALDSGGDAENPNATGSDTLADEVQVNLHMLRALMLHRVSGEVHRADVVTVDEGCALKRAVEFVW